MKKHNSLIVTFSDLFSATRLFTKLRYLAILFILMFIFEGTAIAQWTPKNTGLSSGFIYALADNGGDLFAGTGGSGIFHTTNNGSNWTAINTGLTNNNIRSFAFSGSNLFAGTYGGGVFRSTDNGLNWIAFNNGLTNLKVYALAVNGTNLFAGTDGGGIFISTTSGANWTPINAGLTNLVVYSLAFIGNEIFAGTNIGIFHSINYLSWSSISSGLTSPYNDIRSLFFNGTNLFAGSWGRAYLYNGSSWDPAYIGLPNNSLVQSFAVCGTNLYAGTINGVFHSTNNGNSWSSENTGLTTLNVPALAVSGTSLFAGTFGGGVFSSSSCVAAAAATVTPGGPDRVCQSASPSAITLSGASVGGSATTGAWSITFGGGTLSNNSQTATPSSVTYTPAANYSGTVTLTLTTNGSPAASDIRTITVSALPAIAIITGTTTLCVGSTTQLADATAGGAWSSVSNGVATISAGSAGGSGGLVTGISVGTTTITYTVRNVAGCTNSVTQTVTVNGIPTITGTTPGSRCGTGTVPLGATASSGIINWYAVSTGGTSLGTGTSFTTPSITTTTTYYVDATDACGTTAARTAVAATINTPVTYYLDADGDGYGGSTTILSCTPLSGYVTIPGDCNDNIASIHPGAIDICNGIDDNCNGIVDETAPSKANAGTDQIGVATCGLTTVTLSGNNPAVGTGVWSIISGTGGSFANSALYNTTFTGTAGTAYILRWTISNAPCPVSTDDVLVTLNQIPAITETTPASRCGRGTVTLGATASSGTINWYEAATGGTSLGTGSTYTTPGITTTTTYYVDATDACGTTAVRTAVVATIDVLPIVAAITGTFTVCLGSTTQLANATSGGIWTSGTLGVATVNASTGLVTGVSAGTALITYTIGGVAVLCSNSVTQTVTVNASPTITGTTPGSRCGVGTVTLGSIASAGTINWYAALTGGVSLGTGNSYKTPIITSTTTYYVDVTSDGCTTAARTAVVATINPLPVVSASVSVAVGSTITLSPTTGGTWLSNYPLIASVTNAGVVTGLLAGTATFTFTDAITGCKATTTAVTVGSDCIFLSNSGFEIPVVGPSIPGYFTQGYIQTPEANVPSWHTTASDAKIEIWDGRPAAMNTTLTSLSGNQFAELNCTQLGTLYQKFTAIPNQQVLIKFLHMGRYAGLDKMELRIGPDGGPYPLIGTYYDNYAGGWTSYSIPYTFSNIGGLYQIRFVSISSNGGNVVTPGGNFLDNISIECLQPGEATVTAGGPDNICQSASPTAIQLSGASIGGTATMGTWSIVSGNGLLSDYNLTASPASVFYTLAVTDNIVLLKLTTNSIPAISATRTITINQLPAAPAAITGTFTLCVGSTTQLADVTGGGIWTSGSTGVATVNASTGIVTGVSAGTALITYTIGGVAVLCSNSVTKTVTVNANPTITGTTPASRCGAGAVTLGATVSAGIINWYATLTGGVSLGTGNSYTTPSISSTTTYYVDATSGGCTTGARTAVVATINALPTIAAITGTFTLCVGSTAQLSDATTGGIWSSGTLSVATVNASTGLVTGVTTGTAIITYTIGGVSVLCSNSVTQTVTVNASPTITGTTPGSRCGTGTLILGATASSGIINWYDALTGGNLVGTGNSYTTPSISSTTTNYVDATSGGCTTGVRTAVVATIIALPVVSVPVSITAGSTITLSPTTGGAWSSGNLPVATVTNAGILTGVSAGTALLTFTNTITGCSTITAISVIANNPCVYLCNSDFEQFSGVTPPSGFSWFPQANIPCWKTTALDGKIEIWHSGYGNVPAPSGNYFAELNATQIGTLYQTFSATALQNVIVSGEHRGRYAGVDKMKVWIGPDPLGPFTDLGTYADNNTAWNMFSTASYTIPTTGIYRIKFESISSNNGSGPPDGGNFLDDIKVSCPSSICGIKYNDLNGDGQKQSNEPVLANWEIKLSGSITMTATTGADGSYCFNNLPSGSYTIKETQQSGWLQTTPANPGTYSVNLIEGQNVVGKDFGNRQPSSSSCTDFEDGTNGGWQVSNSLSSIVLDGTNHYIQTTDQPGASSLFNNSKPLTGNWTDLLANGCGSLCFDVNFLYAGDPYGGVNPPSTVTPYISISGNGFSAAFIITNPILAGSGWHSYCAPLAYLNLNGTLPSNADGYWVMGTGSNTDWNSLLSNVTQVRLPVDPSSYQGEQFGYDNICLKNTGDCAVPCCENVKVVPVLDAASKPACSAKITATCEVRSIEVTVSNGTLSSASWNCTSAIPTGYVGLSAYTFVPSSCIPELTTSVNATTSGIVTITYDITFSTGEKCQKKIELRCGVPPPSCCEQVKAETVVDAAGKPACSAKITANCEVKAIAVTVTNGTLSSVNWNCSTAIPTGYIGLSIYTFAPGSCNNPEMTINVNATTSGTVTITYDITFANGEKCQKTVRLDCSVPLCCDGVKVEPVVDATGKASCCAKITTTCEVKSISVVVSNGTLSSVNWNCPATIPTGYVGQMAYTFAPGNCNPVMTTCVNAIKTGMVSITYDILFANGETCQKTIRLDCAVPSDCVTPPTGMVLWLPGDGNAFDISGLNNHGTLAGGTTYSTGKVAAAFKVGNYMDQITVADNSSLNFGRDNFSADAWIKTTDNLHAISIVDKSVSVGSNMTGYRLIIYQGYLYFQMGDGTVPLSQWVPTIQLADGAWHFVAVTVDRKLTDGGKLYIDGSPVLTFDPTTKPGSISSTIPLTVAGNNMANLSGTSYTFYLDEVELFNRAITGDEIVSIFNAGSAGKCKLGSICGTKFNDLNGNGRRDKDEPGIPEWKIVIGGMADLSAMTDKDGNYCFYNLEPGEYKIGEEVRAGWQQMVPAAPGTYTLNLPAGQNLTGLDFGNRLIPQTGSICGSKFNDLNGNGRRDDGEPVMSGWNILLNGAAEMQVITNEKGEYCFDNLNPGIYKVGEESRSGWLQMKPTGGSYNIVLAAGDHLIGQDFGNMLDSRPASICGIKFNDLNGNGTQDPNEPGLLNWTINLTGSATMTATTDGKGRYCFTGLKAGTYTISEVNQPLWHQTTPRPAGTYTVTLVSGEYLENQNFGNQHDLECVTPPVGMLGWWPGDDNTNDITLNGDFGTLVNGATYGPGMVGSAFSLMGSTDYVNVPDRPQLNPANGDFTIDCWINTSESSGIHAILDKQALDANQQISGYGLYVVDGYLQLRLSDMAGNGFGGAIFTDNTTMIADGQWHFVAATIEQGTNHAVTLFVDGVMGIPNTWGYPYLNYSNTVALRIGEAYFNAYSQNTPGHFHNFQGMIDEVEFIFGARSQAELAGIYNAGSAGKCKPAIQLGSICGSKFNDLNGNGIRDARGDGEPGIPNWTIKLNGAATMTTTTDANGNFCFNNLPAGQYTLAEVNQDGWIQTAPLNPNTFTVTLTPGGHIELLNFGNKIDPAFGCVTPPSGMVLWLPGDGHARDISGMNNHGTIEVGVNYVFGKVDQAFNVNNGNINIAVPDNASLNFGTGNFSIDAWVKTTDNVNYLWIAQKGYANESLTYAIGYYLGINQGKLSFWIADGSPGLLQAQVAGPAGQIADGKWHFVAATIERNSNTGGKLFVDGNLVFTFDPTSRPNSITNNTEVRIGLVSNAGSTNFQLDEVELFNRAITSAEITSIYNAGSFGKCKLGSICGMKFNDLNGNGRKDEGEPGIADWLINLIGAANLSARTEKDGSFCFTNLNSGDYQIGEEVRDGWTQTTPGAPGTFAVKLSAGKNLTGYNFGNNLRNPTSCVEPPSGMVGWWPLDETSGTTANDLAGYNNSGMLMYGPLSVTGKVLKGLQFDGKDDFVYAPCDYPDAAELNFGTGDFSFDCWIQTDDKIGTKALVDKHSVPDGKGYSFLLKDGKLSLRIFDLLTEVYYYSPVFVADNKWHHIAVTVSRSTTDGITFYLDGADTKYGDPTSHQTSLSNDWPVGIGMAWGSNPFYFKGILDEIELFNRVITKAEVASIFNAGSSGKCKLGSICGTKFNDLNGNGRRDEGEPGIAEWRIMLDGTASLTAITDKDGNYYFTNLVPGDYKIREGLRPNWQQKMPASGYYAVALQAGQNITRKDFGNMLNAQLGSICGMKYNDLNGNGKRDEGEPGIGDWTILIGGTADFTVQTDKNGEFCFTNLKPGTYKIGEQSRQGWVQTAPSSRYFTFELKAGDHITGHEFGNMLDPKTGSICGMKFNDANGNGTMDNGEQGIPDWTINLSGAATATTTTGKDGTYCFTKLPAGEYTIAEGSRNGWYQITPESGTFSFTLKPGESVVRMNFGNRMNPCTNELKSWSALGAGFNYTVRALAKIGGVIYAGGDFTASGGVTTNHVARWNGTSWTALGTGMNGNVVALLAVGTDLYAGGYFTTADGLPANHIAKWNGTNWSAVGTGMNGNVNSLAVLGTAVYAAGGFSTADGLSAKNIAKWNGTNWSALGIGTNAEVYTVAAMGGNIYTGGSFSSAGGTAVNHIAKWDGTTWSALGSGIPLGFVWNITVIGNDFYAGGQFNSAGGITANNIAKWNGTTLSWSSLGNAGTIWSLGSGGTDLYAGGMFTNLFYGGSTIPAKYIGKWDGTSWTTLGSGLNLDADAIIEIGGAVYAGGGFTIAGGISAKYVAKYSCANPTMVGEIQLQQPYQLEQNYPNPFSSTSTIGYSVPQTSLVKIIVYDLYGKEIKVLVNEEKEPGHHEIVFERNDFVSGIYFYTLKTTGFTQSKKMIIMK